MTVSTAEAQTARKELQTGLIAGLPVALGYIPIAIAFGLLAENSGLSRMAAMLMSFMVYAGASQFMGVNLLALGAASGEIILTIFILNLRHFLMSAVVAQRLPTSVSTIWRAVLAFGITDETFAVATLNTHVTGSRYYLLGLNFIAFSAWNIGTWLGFVVAGRLPVVVQSSMGIALYAMFMGLLIPSCKRSRAALTVAVLAAILHCLAVNFLGDWLTGGGALVIAAVTAAAIGAGLFK